MSAVLERKYGCILAAPPERPGVSAYISIKASLVLESGISWILTIRSESP